MLFQTMTENLRYVHFTHPDSELVLPSNKLINDANYSHRLIKRQQSLNLQHLCFQQKTATLLCLPFRISNF